MATYETKLMDAWRRVKFCEDELVGALHLFQEVLDNRPQPTRAIPAFHLPSTKMNCCATEFPHSHVKYVPFVPEDGQHPFFRTVRNEVSKGADRG